MVEQLHAARPRSGFTLVELLVVIAILGVLAGLVTTSVAAATRRSAVAKATSDIGAIKLALAAYNEATGLYPGAGDGQGDAPDALYRALCTADSKLGGSRFNHLEDWPLEGIGLWPGAFLPDADAEYAMPTPAQLDREGGYTLCVLLDPWGRPYHYVEWKSLPKARRRLPGGGLEATRERPYALWSSGPNGRDERGEGDDVRGW